MRLGCVIIPVMAEENEKDNLFVELAKVKSTPRPLKIATEGTPTLDEDAEGTLTVDVFKDGDDYVVQSTVAGVKDSDLDINITNESVTIRGEREKEKKVEDHNYFYQECYWGKFSRSIILPEEIDPEKSTAVVKSGILTIRMPKLSRHRAKKLKVKATEE